MYCLYSPTCLSSPFNAGRVFFFPGRTWGIFMKYPFLNTFNKKLKKKCFIKLPTFVLGQNYACRTSVNSHIGQVLLLRLLSYSCLWYHHIDQVSRLNHGFSFLQCLNINWYSRVTILWHYRFTSMVFHTPVMNVCIGKLFTLEGAVKLWFSSVYNCFIFGGGMKMFTLAGGCFLFRVIMS